MRVVFVTTAVSVLFATLAVLRIARDGWKVSAQNRIWLTVAVVFAGVSAWGWYRP